MEQESVVDGNLSTEASLIVLDTLEVIVKVKGLSFNVFFPVVHSEYCACHA